MLDLGDPSAAPEEEALRLTSLEEGYNLPPEGECAPGGASVGPDPPARAGRSVNSNLPNKRSAAMDTAGENAETESVVTCKLPLRQLDDFFLHDENGQACRLEVWHAVD
jgi:hypothetical protein